MKYLIVFLLLPFCTNVEGQTKLLKVEPNHSTVGFEISIAGFSIVYGKFTDYSIELDWDDKNLNNCKIKAIIQANSINTGIPDRDEHLKSKDFFEIENFPSIEFSSEDVIKTEAGYSANGMFTMHGISKSISLPFQIKKIDGNTIGFSCRTTINRQDYGVGSSFKHTSMPDFLNDNVDIRIDFWTKKRTPIKPKQ